MSIVNHILGFPRIGINRELKKAQENYWLGNITKSKLLSIGKKIRAKNWKIQKDQGINLLPVGDFAWYDHVLNTSLLLGNIPLRHMAISNNKVDIDTLFLIARGVYKNKKSTQASEMTKWFNTNYHYIVPEFTENQSFIYSWSQLLDEVDEALSLGYNIKPVILGPITYLWLGKVKGNFFERLNLLDRIFPIYSYIISELSKRGITWVQIDEPVLSMDLPNNWLSSFKNIYKKFKYTSDIKILLTTYFGSINHNIDYINQSYVDGIHIDLLYGKYNLDDFVSKISSDKVLSLGIINGKNIWKADLVNWFNIIKPIIIKHKKIWLGSSCSLMHSPIDLNQEKYLDDEVKNWFSFSVQKCKELSLITDAINNNNTNYINDWSNAIRSRNYSKIVHNSFVTKRVENISSSDMNRKNVYSIRCNDQRDKLNLPLLPTTTIGSFPQTDDIRKSRLEFKSGKISIKEYNKIIKENIKKVILEQERLDIDLLVHGEPERNDMVEYFGEYLDGFVFTFNGWVQSYGSRCVKPPIIIGDISRKNPITIKWTSYAQSLTSKPVKGMLTGPVTILCWSFPREDISREVIAKQIALSLRDEVTDLEKSGINVIQIDEPALREGLPLRQSEWNSYLKWAVDSFRLSSSSVKNSTQIHTHMCYCEFNDIIDSISALDADVITIETSRSDMDLLNIFEKFSYPNEIGPGVYDIHSPTVPDIKYIESLLIKALKFIPINRLWVNPDCGLKTRNWKETILSLKNMVIASKNLRKKYKVK
ncbi:5-methyltetrahydropteroyltriglutamate--homocysteine S-methyltransferase [Buchnera aphidicola (Neophyllaphis varicolor)]|uniref:5-methyltetrahydropteroyltriglutamate-- homocysteine S-methyltransferase n=1 Tax=Buchnera aphidicola TaxID=9 RepID=UPI0031B80D4D